MESQYVPHNNTINHSNYAIKREFIRYFQTRSSHRKCSVRKMLLKILQISECLKAWQETLLLYYKKLQRWEIFKGLVTKNICEWLLLYVWNPNYKWCNLHTSRKLSILGFTKYFVTSSALQTLVPTNLYFLLSHSHWKCTSRWQKHIILVCLYVLLSCMLYFHGCTHECFRLISNVHIVRTFENRIAFQTFEKCHNVS